MNREEIEWITQNLFVGNRLWSRGEPSRLGRTFDLREIKSPIILFASMGDNITPPQQAFKLRHDLGQEYAGFLPPISREQMRRIRGEQDVIVRYEPGRALATLPKLLSDPADRDRAVTLIRRLAADERVRARWLTLEDHAQIDAVLGVLGASPIVMPAAAPLPHHA